MGRKSQLFWFLNMEEVPSAQQRKYIFTKLYISEELKEFRREYRQSLKEMQDINSANDTRTDEKVQR